MILSKEVNTNLIDTGSEILTGFSRHPANSTWSGFSHNWNLLLVVKGDAELQFNGERCALPCRSLSLVVPAGIRNFVTNVPWECRWIHFDRNFNLNDDVEWKEVIPGVRTVRLETADFRLQNHLFLQVAQVAARRERYWKQLLYCLIREIILRGNTASSRGFGCQDTALAQKMLSNLQENLSMDEIASRCGLSRSAFFAKFAATFDMSPRRYRENHLMQTVQRMLENTNLSITEICEHVHMSSPFYLSSRFKAYSGLSPQAYRRSFRRNQGQL